MDFVIYYESISRELESACLLKAELERRGYTVKVINEHSLFRFLLAPKVIVTPYLYSTDDVMYFNRFLKKRVNKIINLQYEQALSKASIKEGFHNPKGQAKKAIHITWGKKTEVRLINNDVPAQNIKTIGNISMDLNTSKFKDTHLSKENLGKEFEIDSAKKWHLFISSFVFDSLSDEEMEVYQRKLKNLSGFRSITKSSKIEILKWIEKVLELYPDIIFIYRPHPNEKIDSSIKELIQNYNNFKCISKYSVRQWIFACESISNWYSTSIADAYYAKKMCYILRPYVIPDEYEEVILDNCKKIKSLDEFIRIYNERFEFEYFPVKKDVLKKYYGDQNDDGNIYYKVADLCEEILESESYDVEFKSGFENLKVWRYILLEIIAYLAGHFRFYKIIPSRYKNFFEKMYKNKKNKRKVEKKYTKKIRSIISDETKGYLITNKQEE